MNDLKRGTPKFGFLSGCLFAAVGAMIMWIGFWKTLLLIGLFIVGYFAGAVNNKSEMVRNAVDMVIPGRKEQEAIDFKAELKKEQESLFPRETERKTVSTSEEEKEK